MSKQHSVAVHLANEFSYANCRKIVKQGKTLGMIYYNIDFYKFKSPNYLFDVDEAVDALLTGIECDVNVLYFKFLDIYSQLMFISAQSLQSFIVDLDVDYGWKKEFNVFYDKGIIEKHVVIDNARYARLLLDLVENFHVTNFEISELEAELAGRSLTDLDKDCLTVKIINKDDFQNFCKRIIDNIYLNESLVVLAINETALSRYEATSFLYSEFSYGKAIELYITTNETHSKLIISWEVVMLYPLEPVRTKLVEEKQVMDIAFYVRLLLDICENYAIVELKTTFGEVDSQSTEMT